MSDSYNKLVRDNIPQIIREAGKECAIEIMSAPEYKQALRDKVMEEAQEVAEAEPEELVKELADLYEVMDALMDAHEIDRAEVIREQERRRGERGGFRQRIRLLRVWAIFP